MPIDSSGVPAPTRMRDSSALIPRAARWLSWVGMAPRADDPRLAALERATLEGDPLADALVTAMEEAPRGAGRRMLEQALEQGIEHVEAPPPALRALFAQVDAAPAWLDHSLAARGADAMLRQGAEGLCALSAVSLMGGYLSSAAVKPLVQTGELVERAPRRLAETTQFVWSVANSGSLTRASEGFKACVRVRVMHAFVRRGLRASPAWRTERWGVPINQRDMVATHLSFTIMFIAGSSLLGRIVSGRERDAIAHLWRYVSFLLGTPDALVPKTFREAVEIGALFNLSEPGPDADGRALASALMAAWRADPLEGRGRWVSERFGDFMQGYSRYALGQEAADRLGIPDTWWKHVPPALALVRFTRELLGRLAPARNARGVEQGRRVIEQRLSSTLRGEPARYVAPREAHALI
ncbi:MAG TPA: oxygenase MpaB family protein [Polyangiales bacterium]